MYTRPRTRLGRRRRRRFEKIFTSTDVRFGKTFCARARSEPSRAPSSFGGGRGRVILRPSPARFVPRRYFSTFSTVRRRRRRVRLARFSGRLSAAFSRRRQFLTDGEWGAGGSRHEISSPRIEKTGKNVSAPPCCYDGRRFFRVTTVFLSRRRG